MNRHKAFGDQIRYWRKARSKTQLDVAIKSGYSQRHVSFLESGRASPSREAVIVLADTLNVPMTARNALLEAAGFAPIYTHEPLSSKHLEYAVGAIQDVLTSHRPFPAIVVDRAWNIFGTNECAGALFQHFIADPDVYGSASSANAIRTCLDERGMKPFVRNWNVFIRGVLGQLKDELERDVTHNEISTLIDDIHTAVETTELQQMNSQDNDFPVILLELEREETRVDLFTMMSRFNFPRDATLAELRIETFFPANPASRQFLEELDKELADGGSLLAPASA